MKLKLSAEDIGVCMRWPGRRPPKKPRVWEHDTIPQLPGSDHCTNWLRPFATLAEPPIGDPPKGDIEVRD